MSEEEKKAIEYIEDEIYSIEGLEIQEITFYSKAIEDIKAILNLVQKQQKEKEKLKKHNKELLRKLRNRVKEVKKLTKYSLYKKEFAKLNREIEKKDKIIDEMLEEYEYNARIKIKNFCDEEMRKNTCIQDCRICIKQYFEKKVEEEYVKNKR